jgi:hypothetical protein
MRQRAQAGASRDAEPDPEPGRIGPPRPRHRTVRWSVPVASAILLVLLAACSSGGSDSTSSANGAAAAPHQAAEQPAGAAAGAAADKAGAPPADTGKGSTQPEARIAPSRALIRKVELTVRVTNVQAQATTVGTIARESGGDVYSDNRSGTDENANANIVIKIDPNELVDALTRISKLGDEVQRASSTEDVTAEVADVESRVTSMKASIARMRVFLSRATSIGDVVNFEAELSKREAELESLQARQRTLGEQLALATVTVNLVAKKAPPAPAAEPKKDEGGFLGGLQDGWTAFAATMGGLLTVIGAVLPFLLIVVPILFGWRYVAQRQRRPRTPIVPTPATATGPPATPSA